MPPKPPPAQTAPALTRKYVFTQAFSNKVLTKLKTWKILSPKNSKYLNYELVVDAQIAEIAWKNILIVAKTVGLFSRRKRTNQL